MEFKRFVSYMYGYQQNVKQENCGFVKVEVRQNMARFLVHIYMPRKHEMECKVYGFVRKEQILEGILLGTGRVKNGNLDVRIHGNAENLGTEELPENEKVSMEQLSGLVIVGLDESVYGTVWDEGELDVSRFRTEKVKKADFEETEMVKDHTKDEEIKEEEPEENIHIAEEEALHTEEFINQESCQEKNIQEKKGSEQNIFKNDSKNISKNVPKSAPRETILDWNTLQKVCPVINPFEIPRNGQYLRMQPKDLKHFSKELWHLGSNSFLLHGYYNYRYLIIGKEQNGFLLGIPGSYYPKEESIATMFGFPAFLPAQRQNKDNGRFGYWCRWIS